MVLASYSEMMAKSQISSCRLVKCGVYFTGTTCWYALVVVTVAPHGEGIGMTVRDDGVGFDPSAARTGFGLDGISDRATLAGGSVEVDSVPGRGSVLTILLPRAGVAA